MKTDKRYFRYEKCLQILLNTKINKGEITLENTDFLITCENENFMTKLKSIMFKHLDL